MRTRVAPARVRHPAPVGGVAPMGAGRTGPLDPRTLLALQRGAGNTAVTGLLAMQRLTKPLYKPNPPWATKGPEQSAAACTAQPPNQANFLWEAMSEEFPAEAERRCRCKEVRPVWNRYFEATGGSFVFRDGQGCITDDLRDDDGAHRRSDAAIHRSVELLAPLVANELADGQVHDFPLAEAPDPTIDFNRNTLAGGQLFGGVGSSEAGPDTRSRSGTIHMKLVPDPDGAGLISRAVWTVDVDYHHTDGVDFCPGNTGEHAAFILQAGVTAVSQCEASGMARDVRVEAFYRRTIGPRSAVVPVPPPAPPTPPSRFPRTGPAHTTGSFLQIRTGPSRSFRVVGSFPTKGTRIDVLGQQHGEDIDGNDVWNQIDRGFVSDRFVAFAEF